MRGGDGWNSNELRLLRGRSENEWLEWIGSFNAEEETEKSGERFSNVLTLVATFLRRFESVPDPKDKATVEMVRKTLELLRDRSLIDQLRVEKILKYAGD